MPTGDGTATSDEDRPTGRRRERADLDPIGAEVAAIRARNPDLVVMWSPRVIGLVAYAEPLAREIHQRLGDEVEILLGAFRYPSCTWWPGDPGPPDDGPDGPDRSDRPDGLAATVALPDDVSVTLVVPPSIAIGPPVTLTATIANHGPEPLVVVTVGTRVLDGYLVEPGGSRAVGGLAIGARTLMAVSVTVEPGSAEDLPVLVGTDSFTPRLGYVVPPGRYDLVVPVATPDHRYRTAPVPIMVTAPA